MAQATNREIAHRETQLAHRCSSTLLPAMCVPITASNLIYDSIMPSQQFLQHVTVETGDTAPSGAKKPWGE
ncbi:hypothetical protein HBH56_011170 [Parastagonospora nodorum]|uniref:Uncharacterized protein n=1 Tax=Phaeosphaeria nodorum (strain SN15 / ATCC MYA-4574 / FGSC 10173) TaxID=321614 RepID=Q0V6R1_PHANO|nr:hypothetical protein SNOG_00303 [Parastagonospora nodorum SN15]KAH3920880.1 hypothetical protein HBH56_011170 [Parastagonospora nodorum]EAT91798.1 hypothetical protein SNOG_00303 [Parastagonospora nodorum SN15]KAH3934748.1 hypothetical protein HBH54_044470 [Parastagonospora nodorum]KAH4000853.1 hypothetical protein HBI10_094760 [Parastagonospora nodorum]KAH4060550.1 hypothetical protein HBH49_003700 [Parastagonospora nodorum]